MKSIVINNVVFIVTTRLLLIHAVLLSSLKLMTGFRGFILRLDQEGSPQDLGDEDAADQEVPHPPVQCDKFLVTSFKNMKTLMHH